MAEIQQFWNAIALAIQEKFENGRPETWNKYKITTFLADFSTQLGQVCSQDEHRAMLCGVKKIKRVKSLLQALPTTLFAEFS